VSIPADLNDYLRAFGQELANRILQSFPPLQGADDPLSPLLGQLLRQPYPAQAVAAMGVARRWEQAVLRP